MRSRATWLVATVAACVVLTKVLAENVFGLSLEGVLVRWAAHPGSGAGIAILTLLAVDIVVPVPSSLVMIASGALFGVPAGAALSLVGSLCGEWLGFEVARRYGRAGSRRLIGDADLDQMSVVMARHGGAAVAVTRAIPVLMETTSIVAGLSAMPRLTFLLASLAGTVPIAVVYAWAGATARTTGNLIPAVIILLAVTGAGWLWLRSSPRQT